ncbi:FG-GAP-like repeat-containing protein [Candidatus Cyanaurora vandensis]|uniref:FG-GAP-like repeat-containing protein n=1 Tax=Candidatus Cyanaurora vandensis TaxID=2714958 RepID=UPI0025804DD3|nr:FG-GAP-like repeat-containing protein [Candidatus Cyanaurora vandensis]
MTLTLARVRYTVFNSRAIALLLITVGFLQGVLSLLATSSVLPDPAMQQALTQARYRVYTHQGSPYANNPAQGFSVQFQPQGLVLQGEGATRPWTLGLSKIGDKSLPAVPGTAIGNRVEYRRGAMTEWYLNTPQGLEQGFTLQAPPTEQRGIRLEMTITGGVQAELTPDGQAILLTRGTESWRYDHLLVKDATGQVLTAQMDTDGTRLWLTVADQTAQYPITIDPLLSQPNAPGTLGGLGTAVALVGDTLVVGAPQDDIGLNVDQGSAYVLVRNNGVWIPQAQLTASDGGAGANFGTAVAISGETVVVGAPAVGVSNAAYVFVRTGTDWNEQQKLTPTVANNAKFGQSVTIQGETLAVGAPGYDTGNNDDRGSAFVYIRSGTTWTLQQEFPNTTGALNEQFGYALALGSETLAVGKPGVGSKGSAFVFVRSGTLWTQQQRLTASDGVNGDSFGVAVAISGETVVVSAPSNDLSGNNNRGAAYVFVRSGTVWSEQALLRTATGADDDAFGFAVAIVGDLIVVGMPGDDFEGDANRGSAFVFERAGTVWTQQQSKLTAGDGSAQDQLGYAVAISGNTIVTGAPGDDINATDQGSALVFIRNGSGWTEQQNIFVTTSVLTITDFTPSGGGPGTVVTINGTNFTGATSVTFNGLPALFTVVSASQITATVPYGAITGRIEVTVPGLGTVNSTDPFAIPAVAVRGSQWQLVGAADFTTDGQADLLWRNYTTGVNEVWQMDGYTYVATLPLLSNTDPAWQLAGAADFTGDGKPDLLWRNYQTGDNAVWELNGTTYVNAFLIGAVTDLYWQLAGAADLTGDGQADLLWRNIQTGDVYVWQMNGYTYVNAFFIGNVADPAWQLVGGGDLTNDGQSDLLWRKNDTGETFVWQMNGYTYVNAFFIGDVTDPLWQLVGSGDLTNDGQADLLWRYSGDGNTYVWEMSGYTYVNAFFLGNRPAN